MLFVSFCVARFVIQGSPLAGSADSSFVPGLTFFSFECPSLYRQLKSNRVPCAVLLVFFFSSVTDVTDKVSFEDGAPARLPPPPPRPPQVNATPEWHSMIADTCLVCRYQKNGYVVLLRLREERRYDSCGTDSWLS